MKKRIIGLTIALTMVLSTSIGAFAEDLTGSVVENNIVQSGDSMLDKPITIEEQEKAILKDSSISNERKISFQKKFKEHKELLANMEKQKSKLNNNQKEGAVTTLTNDASGTIAVRYFKQEKSYWCGPATTKQTVYAINGAANTQTTIATSIGTTTAGSVLSNMVDYVNGKQSSNDYIIVTAPSEALIQSIAEYGVRNAAPPMARLKIAKGGNWAYSSAGHYMNVSGYKSYGAYIRVTDPYIGWVNPSSTGSYYVTSNELYKATINHFAQQMSY